MRLNREIGLVISEGFAMEEAAFDAITGQGPEMNVLCNNWPLN